MARPVPKPVHKRRVPKRVNRGKFSKAVRDKVYERDQGRCRMCGRLGTELHHVVFRSQGGRGVFTNALTLCSKHHREVHDNAELADYWVHIFTDWYGQGFWKDEYDE